jgi:NAD(P)-dependent dehydrogenase (short-subunit alcohol dehydrogenase family)
MNNNFANKTILVTGGTSGIGHATAKQLVEYGAKVIITGRNQDTLDKVVSELGSNVQTIQLDQANIAEVQTLKSKVEAITPSLDGVFLNAGSGDFAPIEMVNEAHFDTQFNSLVKGNFFTAQQLLPLINEGGSVVYNVSSVTELGMAGASIYSAAKGAVKSMVKTFARELAPKNIRVNGVFPGPIVTDFFNKTSLSKEEQQGFGKQVTGMVPLGRFGSSQEVANAVVFLLSDHASYIHGIELPVDGGMTAL